MLLDWLLCVLFYVYGFVVLLVWFCCVGLVLYLDLLVFGDVDVGVI